MYCLQQMKRNFGTAALTNATISRHTSSIFRFCFFFLNERKHFSYISCWVMDTPFSTPPVCLYLSDHFFVRGLIFMGCCSESHMFHRLNIWKMFGTEYNSSASSSFFLQFLLFSTGCSFYILPPRFLYMTSSTTEVSNLHFTSQKKLFSFNFYCVHVVVFDTFGPLSPSPPPQFGRPVLMVKFSFQGGGTFSFHSAVRIFSPFHQKLPSLNKLEFISLFAFSCLVLVNTLTVNIAFILNF